MLRSLLIKKLKSFSSDLAADYSYSMEINSMDISSVIYQCAWLYINDLEFGIDN